MKLVLVRTLVLLFEAVAWPTFVFPQFFNSKLDWVVGLGFVLISLWAATAIYRLAVIAHDTLQLIRLREEIAEAKKELENK